jgi:hypothetical protein
MRFRKRHRGCRRRPPCVRIGRRASDQPRKTAAKPLTGKRQPEPEDARRNEDAMGR